MNSAEDTNNAQTSAIMTIALDDFLFIIFPPVFSAEFFRFFALRFCF
jgi:hypothetical protein